MNQTYIPFYPNRGKPQYHWRLLIYSNVSSIFNKNNIALRKLGSIDR